MLALLPDSGPSTVTASTASNAPLSVCPGEPYRIAYTREVTAKAGDVLWIHAEVETTNDLRDAAGNWLTAVHSMRVTVQGAGVPEPATTLAEVSEGSFPRGLHHVPLSAVTLYRATADGELTIRAEFRAGASDGGHTLACRPDKREFVFLNPEYGGIQVAHFRPFPDVASAAAAKAYALTDLRQTEQPAENSRSYGRCAPYQPALPYSVTVPVAAGDVVLALAQTGVRLFPEPPSAGACAGGRFDLKQPVALEGCRSDAADKRDILGTQIPDELHGLKLQASASGLHSFTASENVSLCLQPSTLFSYGAIRAAEPGEITLSTALNGVSGYGATLLPDAGQIAALRFRPVAAAGSGAQLFVSASDRLAAPPASVAPAEPESSPGRWSVLAAHRVELPAGARLWAAAQAQLRQAAAIRGNVCRSALMLIDSEAGAVGRSPIMARDLIPDTATLPLQNEAVMTVEKAGSYTLELRAHCDAAPASATGIGLQYLVFTPAGSS
ncbi:MAG: hypothetical protein JO038_01565 [Alphaproteobacteria bacterium]|nr:hypothetical protein [Alphaproteobacteria bacterium]